MRCHAALAVLATVSTLTAIASTGLAAAQGLQDRYCLQGWILGVSRQLPVLQLRPMHGHRERY